MNTFKFHSIGESFLICGRNDLSLSCHLIVLIFYLTFYLKTKDDTDLMSILSSSKTSSPTRLLASENETVFCQEIFTECIFQDSTKKEPVVHTYIY